MFYSDVHNGYLLYNSLSNSFISFGNKIHGILLKIKNNPDSFESMNDVSKEFLDELKRMLIIYEGTHEDLLNIIRMYQYKNCYQSNSLLLTIAPTMDCNFKCAYCFENNKSKTYMSIETEKVLVDFIMNEYRNKCFKDVQIDWYGGEPLLAFDSIKRISESLNDCNIKFSSSLITNGYLLDKEKIEQLSSLNINTIQISIDGDSNIHNRSRPHIANGDSYEKIMENLQHLHDYLMQNNVKINVGIRYHVDKNNINCFSGIANLVTDKFPLFILYPSMVQDNIGNDKYTKTKSALNQQEYIDFLKDNCGQARNIYIQTFPECMLGTGCIAAMSNGYVIGSCGELYLCWEDVGNSDKIIGNITKGFVNINKIHEKAKFISGNDPTLDTKCKNCLFLPVCGGGCPGKRIKNKYGIYQYNLCTYFKTGNEIKNFLNIHYTMLKSKTNLKKISI